MFFVQKNSKKLYSVCCIFYISSCLLLIFSFWKFFLLKLIYLAGVFVHLDK